MARVVITGSTAGLGRAAARQLLDGGHEVVLHARNSVRAGSVDELARRAAGVVVGDLASADETRGVADQVNAIGGHRCRDPQRGGLCRPSAGRNP